MPNLSDYDYPLPEKNIALYPPKVRTAAKLLHIKKNTNQYTHQTFKEIVQYFKAGDVLVLNNTRVIPGRLFGSKQTGGKVETLLLKDLGQGKWECLLKPGASLRKGSVFSLGERDPKLSAEVLDDPGASAHRLIRFEKENIDDWLESQGHIPLPPYIERGDEESDHEQYQTVFAKEKGAVASPTAGLHFDEALLDELSSKGVEIVYVTLHVGYGTFQPVSIEDVSKHQMFEEEYEILDEAAEKINKALEEKRRVIACGTTSVRTLESAVNAVGRVEAKRSKTNLFIYPPYAFKVISGLITNFHLPKSTLLMLVDAFLGGNKILPIYKEALARDYRFYSYGDAMVIL